MAYDAERFRASYLGGAALPLPIAGGGGWSIAVVQTDRTRAAVNLGCEDGRGGRVDVFVERRVEGGTCLATTRELMLSYYAAPGVGDARAADVVRAIARMLAEREEALGAAARDALRVEEEGSRTRPTRNVEVRINRECNEECVFCNTPATSDTILPGPDAIREAIDREHDAGHRAITFTGREPTLDPLLPEYVRRARDRGYEIVRVQTNATGLAHRPLLDRLVEAGMDHVEVSLHTLETETFRRLVGAPRLLDKTLEGLKNLGAYPRVHVRLIIVMTALNLDQVPAMVARVARELPHVRAITLSPMAPVGDGARHVDLVPRLASLAGPLAATLEIAARSGIDAVVPSRCGAPLCAMPEGWAGANEELGNVPDRVLEAGKGKARACRECACDAICTGVWAAQLARHGDGEVRPLRAIPARALGGSR